MAENIYDENLIQDYLAGAGGKEKYLHIISQHNSAAPVYDPKAAEAFLKIANCYDYAMDDLDYIGSSSTPGDKLNILMHNTNHGGDNEFKNYIEQNKLGVELDGAHFIPPARFKYMDNLSKNGTSYLIAMYARPTTETNPDKYDDGNGFDFHFARQNNDGTFSQKFGELEPTNLDNSGKLITDPMGADMGNYKFIGFFIVPKNGLDVGSGPKYNSDNVHLTPEQRRKLDAEIMPKLEIEIGKQQGNAELYLSQQRLNAATQSQKQSAPNIK